MDLEVRSVLLVGGRGRGVVGGVQEASNAVARLGGNPEVGASSVENDLERLGRVADGDLGEVWEFRLVCFLSACSFDFLRKLTLSVHEVGDRNGVDAIRLGRLAIEHDINTAGWASTEVLLSELLNLLLNGRAGLE